MSNPNYAPQQLPIYGVQPNTMQNCQSERSSKSNGTNVCPAQQQQQQVPVRDVYATSTKQVSTNPNGSGGGSNHVTHQIQHTAYGMHPIRQN